MLKLAVALTVFSAAATTSRAQDAGALVDKLVKKGVLTSQEGEEVRADMMRDFATQTPAGKLNLSPSVSEMKLSGDLRMRYAYDNRDSQLQPAEVGTSAPLFTANTTGDTANGSYYQTKTGTFKKLPSGTISSTGITFPADAASKTTYRRLAGGLVSPSGFQRSRVRFRLRLDADFKLGPNWFGGVELSTSQASDSGNQTFGDAGTSGGGFNKYSIYISRAFLGWQNDWLTVKAGKIANPFYTTDMVWDPDISPDGISESIALHKLFHLGGGSAGPTGYSKDGKSTVEPAVSGDSPWEFTLNAGQFIMSDNNEGGVKVAAATYFDQNGVAIPASNAPIFGNDSDGKTDVWLFQTQLVTSYKFSSGIKLTVAPGWLVENAGTITGANNENSFNDSGLVSGASRNISLLLFPGDVSFKLGGLKTKFYWDFAYNIEGRKREENMYLLANFDGGLQGGVKVTNHKNEDDYAYLVGVQVGENKKAGDWSLLLNWRQTGIAAVDPNLNDSDFALGELNMRGFKASLAYNFTDFAVGAVSWMGAWNVRQNLIGGEATGGNAIADGNQINVLQVDFSIKF